MMSDSDDTEVLLLLPPDLFVVRASDTEGCSDCSRQKFGVVSDLIDHVQTLESRICAIESKKNNNSASTNDTKLSSDFGLSRRQTLPRAKRTVSRYSSNSQKRTANYPESHSLPSSPNNRRYDHSHSSFANNTNDMHSSTVRKNKKYPESDSVYKKTNAGNKGSLHVGYGSSIRDSSSSALSVTKFSSKDNKSHVSLPALNSSNILVDQINADLKQRSRDMSITQAEEFLRIRETPNSLAYANDNGDNSSVHFQARKHSDTKSHQSHKEQNDKKRHKEYQKIKFANNGHNPTLDASYQSDYDKGKNVSDFTLPNDTSFSSFDTERFNAEFKPWTPSFNHELSNSKLSLGELKNMDRSELNNQSKATDQTLNETMYHNYAPVDAKYSVDNNKERDHRHNFDSKSRPLLSAAENSQDNCLTSCKSCPVIFKDSTNMPLTPYEQILKNSEISSNRRHTAEQNNISNVNGKQQNLRQNRFYSLSDFWNQDSSKTMEEQLRIRLEEERLRREHCEELIQDLQKKLLEYQEKIGVAVRVDNEKNTMIAQFQSSWKKIRQKLQETELERDNIQKMFKGCNEKHKLNEQSYQEQIKNHKEELSKALSLATGYKEKSDDLTQELQNCKSLVQDSEKKYGELKAENDKLLEKNQQTNKALKTTQEELNKELMKSGEVRAEMAHIHKALDTCETELTILRQEKENLQLKLNEELNRNQILEKSKAALNSALEDAKRSEKWANEELNALSKQQDKLRAELRDVYQKQVDDVVKAKLQEFQTQLDSAETVFQNEIEIKQKAIAECAARKIKVLMDKHRLEVNLIEEKHKEEKRLIEIKLAQARQKSTILESQLNNYRKTKNQLVEQIHIMMQKQWQEALTIISRGNGENVPKIPKINVEKFFELSSNINLDAVPKHSSTLQLEPMKLDSTKSSPRNSQLQDQQNESIMTLTSQEEPHLSNQKEIDNDLKKYIKMILDSHQAYESNSKPKFFNHYNHSPPSSQKENSNKQSANQKESNENALWQPVSDMSLHDTSEYLSVPQKFDYKSEQMKHQKPPWK
ncbi:hypothetical protein TKK_0010648 [Trichogramma kaykai]